MTESKYEELSKELIEDCYQDAMFAFRNEIWELVDAEEALVYFEEREEYLNCAGIKKAIDEWKLELLSNLFTAADVDEDFDNTVV